MDCGGWPGPAGRPRPGGAACVETAEESLARFFGADGAEPGSCVGAVKTAEAFGTMHPVFGYFLVLAVFIFAYSTLISWCYYGEKCMEYLFGEKSVLPYRIVYVILAAVAPLLSIGMVITFSELMILALAFPNIIGSLILLRTVKTKLRDYQKRLDNGEMKPLR